MSVQTQEYIKEMKEMYIVLSKKEKLSISEILFLEAYKRTIDSSIEILA
jgi:hypothetical protein